MSYEMTLEQSKKMIELRDEIISLNPKKTIVLEVALLSSVVFSSKQANENIEKLVKIKNELLDKINKKSCK